MAHIAQPWHQFPAISSESHMNQFEMSEHGGVCKKWKFLQLGCMCCLWGTLMKNASTISKNLKLFEFQEQFDPFSAPQHF